MQMDDDKWYWGKLKSEETVCKVPYILEGKWSKTILCDKLLSKYEKDTEGIKMQMNISKVYNQKGLKKQAPGKGEEMNTWPGRKSANTEEKVTEMEGNSAEWMKKSATKRERFGKKTES